MEFHYTVQEVGLFLETDDETVLAWIHSGELIAINIAKNEQSKRPSWRIAESEIGRFLMKRRNVKAMEKRKFKEDERLKAYLA